VKRGDLVKRKGENWIGVVTEMVKTTYRDGSIYEYPKLIWLDDLKLIRLNSCSPKLLEVISEHL